jgi:hypothetical protein
MSTISWIAVILIGLFVAGGMLAAFVVGLGFALGWFRLGASSASGKRQVTFTMEQNKILDDENAVLERVHDLGRPEKDIIAVPVATRKDAAAPVA